MKKKSKGLGFRKNPYIFDREVREILAAFGVNAMVTPKSRMAHFDVLNDFDARMERVRALGIEAEPTDLVYDLALRLHKRRAASQ